MAYLKNLSRTFVAAMVLTFGLSCGNASKAAGVDEAKKFTPDTEFTIGEDGIITEYKGKAKEVIIPSAVNGVTVKGLKGTFKDNKTITNVIIPDTLCSFGDETFSGCSSLSSIDVYDLDAVADKTQFNEWTDYSGYLYNAASDNYVTITDKGSSVVLPASFKAIGDQVFNDCCFVSFFVMDGNTIFKDSNEGGVNQPEGIGGALISYDGKKLYKLAPCFRDLKNSTTYKIPEGVEEIKPYAFYGASSGGMQKVVVSDTVKKIDDYGFYKCNLLEVSFAKDGVCAELGDWAFAYNDNLDIKLPKSVTKIGSYCFAYILNRTPDISGSGITSVPPYVFYGCVNLHTIKMPKTLDYVEGYAFAGCDNLNEVVFLGDTLKKIGTAAFQGCANLHKIDVPEGVKSIENSTFDGCTNLNTVLLPNTLKELGDNAFKECQNIHQMEIPKNVKHISNTTFKGAYTYYIDTSKNEYSQGMIKIKITKDDLGKTFKSGKLKYKVTKAHSKKGTVSVVSFAGKKYKQSTTKLIIPATVKYKGYSFKVTGINNKAFKSSPKLKTVVIGANVTTVGAYSFANCKKLTSMTIGKNVKKIGGSAFYGDSRLASIKIKTTKLTSIGKNALKGVKSKAKITVPKNRLNRYKKLFKKSTGYKTSMRLKKA